MAGVEPWQAILGAFVTLAGSYLVYKGVKATAAASKGAADRTSDVTAQDSALRAWEAINKPLIERVEWLEGRMLEAEEKSEREREDFQSQITKLMERVDFLTIQLQHWKRLAKVMARWATTLRDQVLSLGGTVPATPEELLLIQSLDDDDL